MLRTRKRVVSNYTLFLCKLEEIVSTVRQIKMQIIVQIKASFVCPTICKGESTLV